VIKARKQHYNYVHFETCNCYIYPLCCIVTVSLTVEKRLRSVCKDVKFSTESSSMIVTTKISYRYCL